MKWTPDEVEFLTALGREQNPTDWRGPAHDFLRRHAYRDVPLTGPGSLAFSNEAVPFTGLLVRDCQDLQEIDHFLCRGERPAEVRWTWSSAVEYRARLAEAQRVWASDGTEAPHGGSAGDGHGAGSLSR